MNWKKLLLLRQIFQKNSDRNFTATAHEQNLAIASRGRVHISKKVEH